MAGEKKCDDCRYSKDEEAVLACDYLNVAYSKNIPKATILLATDARGVGRGCGPAGNFFKPR